jgi:hypothetical protein
MRLAPDGSDSCKQSVIMKQPGGTYASVGIAAFLFADEMYQDAS